jgi:hypothetical protein
MARGGGIIIEKICEYLDFKDHMKKVRNKRPSAPGRSKILVEEHQQFMLPPTIPVKAKTPLQIVPDDELDLHF